jgi:hypothetical protein
MQALRNVMIKAVVVDVAVTVAEQSDKVPLPLCEEREKEGEVVIAATQAQEVKFVAWTSILRQAYYNFTCAIQGDS